MKKLIWLLSLILFFNVASFAQYPNKAGNGSANLRDSTLGGRKGNLITYWYADTSAANLVLYLKGEPDIIIRTGGNLTWQRSHDAKRWVLLNSSSFNFCEDVFVGNATWTGTGLDYYVTDLVYNLPTNRCINYNTSDTTLTDLPADPTYDRVDAIVCDNLSQVYFMQGVPNSGIPPAINILTQRIVTIVNVARGAFTPTGVTTTKIYDENLAGEWAMYSNIPSINNAATSPAPCVGTVSTLITNAANGEYVAWTAPAVGDITVNQYLKLDIKLSTAIVGDPNFITVRFLNVATQTTLDYVIKNGSYGFNSSLVGVCQKVVIPLYPPFATNSYDRVQFTISGAPSSFTMDNIYMVSGIPLSPVINDPWLLGLNDITGNPLAGIGTSSPHNFKLFAGNNLAMQIPWYGIIDDNSPTRKMMMIAADGTVTQRSLDSFLFKGCIKAYDSAGIMVVRDTCSGGGGSQDLQQTLDIGNYSTTGIQLNTDTAITKATMTFFGDSWTAGYLLPNQSLKWTTLVANFLGYTENNAGLSSSTLMKRVVVDPFPGGTNMIDRIPLIPYHATGDKIVFGLGLNDVRWNGANYTTTNFVLDYTTVLDSVIARGYSGSDITLISTGYIPPTAYASFGGNPAATLARQHSFDSCISVLATTYGAKYFDAYSFMESHGARTLMQSDSTHPNTYGHQVYAIGFINAYNEPVRFGGQKLAVNGLTELSELKLSTIKATHSNKQLRAVFDENGYLAASTLKGVNYNAYGNVQIGDNADSIPYRLAVDGATLLNDGLNIYNKNATEYNKWLKLFSDFTTGASKIDAYSPSGGVANLSINTESKGVLKLGSLGAGLTTIGTGNVAIDSFYAKITHGVITGFAPARVQGGNLMYFSGNGTIISSNSAASTFDNLSLQGFGGNTNVGKNGTATARLHITASSTTASTGQIKLDSGSPPTTPEAGLINFSNGLFIIDSSAAKRDTIATRSWARANISGGGGGTVTSVTGTASRIDVATGTTTPVIDISTTFEALLGKVANPLSQFASTTSLQLLGVMSDETGTGSLVFATSPTLITPTLGVATATSINKVAITAPATSATLTLVDGGSLITAGAFATTLTSTATTNATLPAGTSTLYGTSSGSITSSQLLTSLSDETGTGVAVFGTSPTFTTQLTSPKILGGTGTTSSLTLQTTTGVGTTNADFIVLGGNNGGSELMRITNAGAMTTFGNVTVGNNLLATSAIRAGASSAIFWNGRGGLISPVDGIVSTTSSALADYTGTIRTAGIQTQVVAKTANYTATVQDCVISCSTNSFTVTLPTAVGAKGQIYHITNSTSGQTITIGTTSSQTFINVSGTPTSITVVGLGSASLVSDNANWIQIK